MEQEMATHSSILAWRILQTEEPGGLQSMGCKELDMTEQRILSLFHFERFYNEQWEYFTEDDGHY